MVKQRGPHKLNLLAAVALNKLGEGWHADGGNLYLFVRGESRTWVFRYTSPEGKRRNMGLGSSKSVTLARARELAAAYRGQVKDKLAPVDPIETTKAAKAQRGIEQAKRMTFKECAEAYIEANRAGWKNAKHAAQWGATLTTYAYPVIGDMPVALVETPLIVRILQPIWTTKTETASRLRGRIENVLDWAKVSGFRQEENPARWRGHLDHILPAASKVAKVTHHAALPFKEISAFMPKLQEAAGLGARALELAILTATRSGEVRGATWAEFDLAEKVWIIPGERMKAGREHRVPLSTAAVKLLKALPRLNETELVFPSSKLNKPLSDMTLTAALKRLDRSDLTAHGFRSTFRDWAAEATNYPREVAEMALAHTIEDAVEAAYRRGDLFEKRKAMMEDWARFCTHSAALKVVKLARKA